MRNAIKTQIYILFHRKSTIFMYFLMFLLVFANFIMNVIEYHGYDISGMYNSTKISFLSDYTFLGYYFIQYYPFLVVIPAAFSYLSDVNSKEIVFMQTRIDKRKYYISKLVATFIVTFIIFTFPLILEQIINYIAFPIDAMGDPSNMDIFDQVYNEIIRSYLFATLWTKSSYLYAIFFIILFGVVSGLLASFALAVSMCGFFKFKILVFVPVYVLLYLVNTMGRLLKLDFNTDYYSYLTMFSATNKSEIAYLTFCIALGLLNILMVCIKMRKDELS